ncbi:sorting nexin-8-like isoform X2 [Littorina saxatilis]|uniref:PX domain-containing protein n=1 Tax=Littorina saxatilis TaxID=31220 RepID=A0AAN9GL99_9CAEN
MSTDLAFGSVPPFYREVYDIVCPNQEQVDRDLFVQILVRSSLPKPVIMQIWDAVDTTAGFMTRNGLYKALALTALAQQGKSINEKLLETFSGQELPRPNLGDLSDMKAASVRLRRERTPNVLGYSFSDLCELDNIKVELVPEKKGLILKHVEYEITSQRFKSTVLRRYNDFAALQEMVMMRFPYRILPRLPPKKMLGANREFIEQRKKALKRYINIMARHPQISDDKLLKFFLTFSGNDTQHKIKEQFRGIPDEFMTSNMASKAKDLVPMDTQTQLGNSREHIRMLTETVSRMKDIAERMVIRSTGFATDMLMFGRQLSAMSSDNTPLTAWATGTNDTWPQLQKGFKHLSVEYATLSDRSTQAAIDLEDGVVEKLSLFLDILVAYRDLCERHEKGLLNEHQRAIQKMGQYKKKKMSATVQTGAGEGAVEQLEQRILEQEGQIANMENRNYYSLHCLQMETQLVYAHLDIFYDVLSRMAEVEAHANSQLSKTWSEVKPIVDTLVSQDGAPSSPTRTSPIGSPTNNNHMGISI